MRLKLFNKFFLYVSLIVLFCLTFVMVILTLVYNNYMTDLKYQSMEKACNSVSDFISNYNGDGRGMYYIINNLSDVADVDVFITDSAGAINVCSCEEWEENGECSHSGHLIPRYIFDSSENSSPRKVGNLGKNRTPHYMYSKELTLKGGNKGYVVAAASTKATSSLVKTTAKLYVFSAVIPVLIMFALLYIISYKVTKPLKLMSVAAKLMAKGDFSKRIPVTSDDEIGELAVSFNQMTNSLVRLEEMRKSFVANISHEFRTPLTTIGGFIDGIIDGTIEPDKQKFYLEIVSNEVKRLTRMVQSMLSIARLESGEFVLKSEVFDFRELLLNIVISQEQLIEAKKLTINGLDALPDVSVTADKDLIHRVLYNLVDNAVKFTNENGEIRFELTSNSKQLKFKITNTGKGIAKKDLPYVFERFYKTDKSRSDNKNSTGLGLYMVKTIIKNHGGNVNVSSCEDEYTAFEFTLPIKK